MTRNDANAKPPAPPVVTVAPDKALWQKVTPETAAQVNGGWGDIAPF